MVKRLKSFTTRPPKKTCINVKIIQETGAPLFKKRIMGRFTV